MTLLKKYTITIEDEHRNKHSIIVNLNSEKKDEFSIVLNSKHDEILYCIFGGTHKLKENIRQAIADAVIILMQDVKSLKFSEKELEL